MAGASFIQLRVSLLCRGVVSPLVVSRARSFASSSSNSAQCFFARVQSRAVLRIDGVDNHSFLQGLTTNNMNLLNAKRAPPHVAAAAAMLEQQPMIYTHLLSPQGRFMYDAFISQLPSTSELAAPAYLIDCDAPLVNELLKRFAFLKLRAKIQVCERERDHLDINTRRPLKLIRLLRWVRCNVWRQ